MLNEERIRLMTRMESYTDNEGKKNMQIGNYFRGDFISLQILKSVINVTIAYVICVVLYILYDLEIFLQEIYKMDLLGFTKQLLLYYAVAVVGYGLITYLVYTYKYSKARKSLKNYYNNLKKINALYED